MNFDYTNISNTYLDESIYQFGKVKKKKNESFFNALQSLKKIQQRKELVKSKTNNRGTTTYIDNNKENINPNLGINNNKKLNLDAKTPRNNNQFALAQNLSKKKSHFKKSPSHVITINKGNLVFNIEKSATKSILEFSEESIELQRRETFFHENKHSTEIFNRDKLFKLKTTSLGHNKFNSMVGGILYQESKFDDALKAKSYPYSNLLNNDLLSNRNEKDEKNNEKDKDQERQNTYKANKSSTCYNTNQRKSSKSSKSIKNEDFKIRNFSENLCDLDQEVEIPIRKRKDYGYSTQKSNSLSNSERDNSVSKIPKSNQIIESLKLVNNKLLTTKEDSKDSEIYIENDFAQLESDFNKFNLKFRETNLQQNTNLNNENNKNPNVFHWLNDSKNQPRLEIRYKRLSESKKSESQSEQNFATFGNNISVKIKSSSKGKEKDRNQSASNKLQSSKNNQTNKPELNNKALNDLDNYSMEREISFISENLEEDEFCKLGFENGNFNINQSNNDHVDKKIHDNNILNANPKIKHHHKQSSNFNFFNSNKLNEISSIEKSFHTPEKTTVVKEESRTKNNSKNKSYKNLRKNLNFMNMSLSYQTNKTNESFYTNKSKSQKGFVCMDQSRIINTTNKKTISTKNNLSKPNTHSNSKASIIINKAFLVKNEDDKPEVFSNISIDIEKDALLTFEQDYTQLDKEAKETKLEDTFFEINEEEFQPTPVFDIEFVQNLIDADNFYNPKYYSLINKVRFSDYFGYNSEGFRTIRAQTVDWMMEISEDFGFKRDTYHIAANYLDRYLEKSLFIVPRESLKLLASTCLLIASKIEEIQIPRAEEYSNVTENEFTVEELINLETNVIQVG